MWHRPMPRFLLALAILVGLLVWKGPALLSVARFGSWATVQGKITQAASVISSLGANRNAVHRVSVEYEYRVGGVVYTNDRFGVMSNRVSSRDAGDRFAVKYPQGASVTVHYDPAAPKQSSLVAPTGGGMLDVLFIGVGMIVCLACAGYYGYLGWAEHRGSRA